MPLTAASTSFEFVRLLDVVGANPLENVAEQIELPISIGRGSARARPYPDR